MSLLEPVAYSLEESVVKPIQSSLVAIGINNPIKLALLISAVSYGTLYILQPSSFYNPDGTSRPWNIGMTPADSKMKGATPVPSWLASLAVGYTVSLFI